MMQHRPRVERKAEMKGLFHGARISWSSISRAAGMMPAPMMSLIVLVASSTSRRRPAACDTPCGSRVMRTHTLVTMPNVPSLADDARRSDRSPGLSSAGPPVATTRPSGSTISTPST